MVKCLRHPIFGVSANPFSEKKTEKMKWTGWIFYFFGSLRRLLQARARKAVAITRTTRLQLVPTLKVQTALTGCRTLGPWSHGNRFHRNAWSSLFRGVCIRNMYHVCYLCFRDNHTVSDC